MSEDIVPSRPKSIIEIHQIGSLYDCDNHIVVYENSSVRITSKSAVNLLQDMFFQGQKGFVGELLQYLSGKLDFFNLEDPYQNEGTPAYDTGGDTSADWQGEIWAPNQLDSIYIIKVDFMGRRNEIAFSYSFCPENLRNLRAAIDRIFFDAHTVCDLLSLLDRLK